MEDFMICAKCGTEMNEGSEFCSKCGTKVGLSTEGQNTIYQQNENRPVPTQVVAISTGTGPLIMGLLGLFGGFIPIVKYFTGLLSLLAVFIGVSQRKKLIDAGLPTGKATAGIVLGTIAVLITVITIAISAIIVGSLFGGGSSSNSTSRINFLTNTLPEKVQGTVWTNGYETVEFGRNRVKLNNEWYRVKKITKGNLRSNQMYAWVEFGDRYVTLENWSSNHLKLTRLYRIGVRGDNYISGFMTPAEFEVERIKRETMAKEILGTWEGSLAIRPTAMTTQNFDADMTLNIIYQDRQYQAELNFIVTNNRGLLALPINTKGACILDITENGGEYSFVLKQWTTEPQIFNRVLLRGTIDGNVLSGTSSIAIYRRPDIESGTFSIVKKD